MSAWSSASRCRASPAPAATGTSCSRSARCSIPSSPTPTASTARANFNDRLLLGLKGTMSEAELHLLKARLHAGQRAKARRGELGLNLPRGYVRRALGRGGPRSGRAGPGGDPAGVRAVRAPPLGPRRAALPGRARHPPSRPRPIRPGQGRDPLEPPQPQTTLQDMLRHPGYAGAYVYGRRRTDQRLRLPGKPHSGVASQRPRSNGRCCCRDCWPAYLDWATYERNQEQMAANRTRHQGVPRGGPALLAAWSGAAAAASGWRSPTATTAARRATSAAIWRSTYGAPRCQSISGRPVDALVAELMLSALAPSAVEVALQLAEDLELERAALQRQWAQRLERAALRGRAGAPALRSGRPGQPAGRANPGARLGGGPGPGTGAAARA